MIQPAKTDIIQLLCQLVQLLKPYAEANGIVLDFQTKQKKLLIIFRPDQVISDITGLICHITNYTPPGQTIIVSATIETKAKELDINIINTGINLSPVAEITRWCRQAVIVKGDNIKKQTSFSYTLQVAEEEEQTEKQEESIAEVNKNMIPDYYDEIRKRLRRHFSKADNLVAQLSILYPKEAAFLQRINAVIIANLENEFFDSSALSREMNMSRTQLFRRLKPLIQQPPAKYIKNIRLERAKELLETTDITVGEAAFKTGFLTQSHFTKAFVDSFGFRPSAIKRKNGNATNE